MDVMREEYSIKEISEITGFKPHVIRFYEKEFQLNIPRNESNRRIFTYQELEKLQYIKSLKEKGLTNRQIKQVLESPEIIINEIDDSFCTNENATTSLSVESSSNITEIENCNDENILKQLVTLIHRIDYRKEFEELQYKIDKLHNQMINQEKDILICENAKLKMKLKEKSYEVAELKEKLKREQNKKVSIIARIFGTK